MPQKTESKKWRQNKEELKNGQESNEKILIRQMTLEEKAGQVTQLPSRYFAIHGESADRNGDKAWISEEKKWHLRKHLRAKTLTQIL